MRPLLARLEGFFLEPATDVPAAERSRREPDEEWAGGPAVRTFEAAVVGLSAGCGTSTLARALALALSARGTPTAVLELPGGRSDGQAGVVWDLGSGGDDGAQVVAARAEAVVAVAGSAAEPALAELVRELLAERFGPVLLAANRVDDAAPWRARGAVPVPNSRLGAVLTAHGLRSVGGFGAAVAELAERVEESAA